MNDDDLNALLAVEEAKTQRDLGTLAARVYAGAREEAPTWHHAFWATVALLTAMIAKPEHGE